jgi:hypothetical protein
LPSRRFEQLITREDLGGGHEPVDGKR